MIGLYGAGSTCVGQAREAAIESLLRREQDAVQGRRNTIVLERQLAHGQSSIVGQVRAGQGDVSVTFAAQSTASAKTAALNFLDVLLRTPAGPTKE